MQVQQHKHYVFSCIKLEESAEQDRSCAAVTNCWVRTKLPILTLGFYSSVPLLSLFSDSLLNRSLSSCRWFQDNNRIWQACGIQRTTLLWLLPWGYFKMLRKPAVLAVSNCIPLTLVVFHLVAWYFLILSLEKHAYSSLYQYSNIEMWNLCLKMIIQDA